jgi:hypothetical protein
MGQPNPAGQMSQMLDSIMWDNRSAGAPAELL